MDLGFNLFLVNWQENKHIPVGLLFNASDVTGIEVADEIVIDPFAAVVNVVPVFADELMSTAGSAVLWLLDF